MARCARIDLQICANQAICANRLRVPVRTEPPFCESRFGALNESQVRDDSRELLERYENSIFPRIETARIAPIRVMNRQAI